MHFLHLSTAGSVDLVRAAKARGVRVTAEATPHHFTLTDAECASFDPVFKVHPPLRTEADVAAIKAGLADGTIDAIATDHAPHVPEAKEEPFEHAPPGMLGLETALALTLTELVQPGVLSLADALARLSWGPARIAGLDGHGGPVGAGAARQPLRARSGAGVGGRPVPSREPVAQHPVPRAQAHRPGPAHDPAGRAGRDRRGGAAMRRVTARNREDAVLVLADGTLFEGEAVGHASEDGVATGEVVFNTAMSGYQEILTDPSLRGPGDHLHVSPHRQLRHQHRRFREPPAVLPRCRRA